MANQHQRGQTPARSLGFRRRVGGFSAMGLCVAFVTLAGTTDGAERRGPGKAFAAGSVKFTMHRVGRFRSEACGVGDFNKDGKLDIVAGPFLYLAPDWKTQKIRNLEGSVDEEGKGYYWDFMNIPLDIDGDGLLDVASCSWHGKRSEWYRNPGTKGGLWPRETIEENGHFEHGDLWDIDGDGKRQEILPAVRGTAWYELGELADGSQGVLKHVVSNEELDWGCGVGDVNGDGRPDILRPNGWFEAPADPRKGVWKKHPLALGKIDEDKPDHTPQIWVHDVNADGLNDIITSSAHKLGVFWYQQIRQGAKTTWKQHVIDATWTQAHSLALADLDNDGDLDLVTGKRFYAHDGRDPGGNEPVGLYWYELRPKGTPIWRRHTLSYDEGIGSGMNIPIVDLDGDGDLDIVVTGKWGGPVWFENQARSSTKKTSK
ncbi:MAG: hypothetical protein CMJ48_15100 [Planctomycetaceae bacterium]|nr:hypothetical protein [Planctomycetaceae bacterium]